MGSACTSRCAVAISSVPRTSPSRAEASSPATSSSEAACSARCSYSGETPRASTSANVRRTSLMLSRSIRASSVYTASFVRHRPARLLPAPSFPVGALRHHHLPPEGAHDQAVLLIPARLDIHDAAVVLGLRRRLVQHLGLAVDGVAVEGRLDVLQRLDLEVRDRLAGDVGH